MVRAVYRTLRREGVRAILTLLAVSAAIAIILVFEGFRAGLYREVRAFPETMPADLIATQAGVSNILGTRSVLPATARREVEAVPGVKAAHPLGGLPVVYAEGERTVPVYVLAYDTAGAPRDLVAGRSIMQTGEIVVDALLARRLGLHPGDGVEFLGYRFSIAGLAAGTSNPFNPYVFVRLIDLVDLYMAGDLPGDLPLDAALSFLLIELEPGANREAVRREIERQVESVDVFTPAEIGEHDVRRARGFMDPPLGLLVVVAYVGGILVVGLTLYASVLGRMREFGVMKALGASVARLAREVLVQALLVTGSGFGVAIILAAVLAMVVAWVAPQYPVEPLQIAVRVRTALATIVMACLGALAPVLRVVDVEPGVVFAQWE